LKGYRTLRIVNEIAKQYLEVLVLIAFNSMKFESLDEFPQTQVNPDQSIVLAIGGDLRKIDVIRDFWQAATNCIETQPIAIWINFSSVNQADTKLAACIVAILRRAKEHDVPIYIIGSVHVQEVLLLCKFPPLKEFIGVNKAA
jgi:anti-anti-sigma regulatory factor